jgi:hypothetical protein
LEELYEIELDQTEPAIINMRQRMAHLVLEAKKYRYDRMPDGSRIDEKTPPPGGVGLPLPEGDDYLKEALKDGDSVSELVIDRADETATATQSDVAMAMATKGQNDGKEMENDEKTATQADGAMEHTTMETKGNNGRRKMEVDDTEDDENTATKENNGDDAEEPKSDAEKEDQKAKSGGAEDMDEDAQEEPKSDAEKEDEKAKSGGAQDMELDDAEEQPTSHAAKEDAVEDVDEDGDDEQKQHKADVAQDMDVDAEEQSKPDPEKQDTHVDDATDDEDSDAQQLHKPDPEKEDEVDAPTMVCQLLDCVFPRIMSLGHSHVQLKMSVKCPHKRLPLK